MRRLSILVCLAILLSLSGCALPEEHRFVNPTAPVVWEPTEPKSTTPSGEVTTPTPAPSETPAAKIAAEMEAEALVAQLFLVKCPAGGAAQLLDQYPVGGIVLYSQDTAGETPASLREKLADYQSRVPNKLLVAVDEEGGIVNRISNREAFRSEPFDSLREIYDAGGLNAVKAEEAEKARFLKDLGINVNLAPVCDVVTDDKAYMADRSLKLTAEDTAEVVAASVEAMGSGGVSAVLKHFPGYGNLNGDTHTGTVVDERSLGQLQSYDFTPFEAGIEAGVGAVMVGHSVVNAIDEQTPATLSKKVIGVLRNELGFKGVLITDDLSMGAIAENYASGEAAVQAILAGNDMLLTTWSEEQYNAILDAVDTGRITMERLRESVTRIIQWKIDLGLL